MPLAYACDRNLAVLESNANMTHKQLKQATHTALSTSVKDVRNPVGAT